MILMSNASSWRRSLAVSLVIAAASAIACIRPNTWRRELVLLSCLTAIFAAAVAIILYQSSTRLLRAIRLTRREHARFEAAVQGSESAFYLLKPTCDASGHISDFRFTYVNPGAERLFRSSRHDLLGMQISAFLPPPTCAAVIAAWAEVARTTTSTELEVTFQAGGQKPETLPTHVTALTGCVAVSTRYCADEKAAAKIQELNEFTQSLLEKAPMSMIATDASGTIVAMNSAAEQLTLYRKHDLVGQHSMLTLHDASEISARAVQLGAGSAEPIPAGFQSLIAHSLQGAPEEREWTYMRKDGSRVAVSLTVTPLRTTNDKTTGYLGIAFDVTERKRLTDSVIHMAHHDQLTGLPNRTLLNERLSDGIERAGRFKQRMAVFMLDIDHFKRINDSLGHLGGDALLAFIAKQLLTAVRSTDTVARVGGDEFVIVMPDFRDEADAERCADLMLQKVCTPLMIGNREVRVTASIGICVYPECAGDASDLLRGADIAMYKAKEEGRASYRTFSDEMVEVAADRLEMEEELRHALDNHEFSLHYQPQLRCSTREVTGMEMLLRWNTPRRGSVPPNVFIPVAEEAGLMVRIGEWALAQACVDCVDAQRRTGLQLTVAVNLSPRQFGQKNLIAVVQEVLASSGLPAEQLELEITEQMLMANTPGVLETLRHLRELGVRIAIDDFGTGFSSFAYILQYNVDRLKIDRSFVSKATQDPGAAAVIRTIIAMAHGLSIDVVAEGVETVEQMNFLFRKKCDEAQGFLFSKAVPLTDFTDAVHKISRCACTNPMLEGVTHADEFASADLMIAAEPSALIRNNPHPSHRTVLHPHAPVCLEGVMVKASPTLSLR